MDTSLRAADRSVRSFPIRLSRAEAVSAAGLVVAGLGVLTLFLGGLPGFPPIPPGPIIMIGIGLLVIFVRWRWIAVVGLVAAVGIAVGFIPTFVDALHRLTDTAHPSWIVGTAGQISGLAVAIVAGVVAGVRAVRGRHG